MNEINILGECSGFELDKGNFLKNLTKYGVTASECEQLFFNSPLVSGTDLEHSKKQSRYYALGHTDDERRLFAMFTIRNRLIRVIFARDMNRKKRFMKAYEKKIPKFKSEYKEREFWATADSTEYIDWEKAKRTVLPNLKPSLKKISLRLPQLMIEELKLLANKRDIPYQSLMKMFLAERIDKELKSASR